MQQHTGDPPYWLPWNDCYGYMPWLAFGEDWVYGTQQLAQVLPHRAKDPPMTPSTGDLPDDGDVIEFTAIPAGSLIPQPVVTPEGSKPYPARRYRVEHKAGQGEYLLVDVLSGHAIRVPAHMLKEATWEPAVPVLENSEGTGPVAGKPVAPTAPANEGILDLKPLPATQ